MNNFEELAEHSHHHHLN
uniref:Uncharacterized protein n=1 Tax=Rhizophora mucronata TaxID=61149 RepID=A0A2P2PW82_RHIMU